MARPSYREDDRPVEARTHAPSPLPSISVLRSFRSDTLRDLARRALAQGWDAYRTGGGHVRLVSPTGQMVEMSTSAAGNGHDQRNVRLAFARAGLDLRPKAERRRERIAARRARPIPQEVPVTTDAPRPPADDPTPFARISETRETIGGRQVLFWRTANGVAWALVAPPGGTPHAAGRKGFSDQGGDEASVRRRVVAYIERGEVPHPGRGGKRAPSPVVVRQATPGELERAFGPDARPNGAAGHPSPAPDHTTPAPAPAPALVTGPTPEAPAAPAGRAPTAGPDAQPLPSTPPSTDDAVAVRASARLQVYPIAAALDDLDRRVGPAIDALEAAGKVDAAALVRAELAMTPAEVELLALYRAVGRDRRPA